MFFDNLQVVHTRSPLLEETHYYPFGLIQKGISAKALNGVVENKKQYVGNELQSKEFSDGSGLELYDFNARTYDQQMGRFIQIDPMADEGDQESWSPYHYSYNSPVTYSDPDGEIPIPIVPILWGIGAWLVSDAAVVTVVAAGGTILALKTVEDIQNSEISISTGTATGAKPLIASGGTAAQQDFAIERQLAKAKATPETSTSVENTGALGSAAANAGTTSAGGKYSHLKEPKNVAPGNKTTPAQRKRILEENKKQNNGQLVSDGDGKPVNPPRKLKPGEKRDPREAQVDHVDPAKPKDKSKKPGTNSNSNLQVLSGEENNKKSNN